MGNDYYDDDADTDFVDSEGTSDNTDKKGYASARSKVNNALDNGNVQLAAAVTLLLVWRCIKRSRKLKAKK